MYVTAEKSDVERSLAVELVLEDIPGGCVIEKDDIPTSSSGIKEGTLVGKGSDGIYHIVKTAMVAHAASTAANALVVYNNHEFKVGDYVRDKVDNVSGVTKSTALGVITTCTSAPSFIRKRTK